MKVEAGINTNDLRSIPAAVAKLERLGYDNISTPEIKNDPFLPLAVAAAHTTRIGISTSAAIAFPRSPMVTAMMAWDLHRASEGRFMLGLATQVKGHNQRRFSTPWVAPAQPRMREYVGAVKAIWDAFQNGTKLDYVGKFYTHTLLTPEFNPGPLPYELPKITITAVGPFMARLAGEVADGVRMHGFCTAKYIQDVIWPELHKGAAKAGRDASQLEVSGGGFIVTGKTQADLDKQLEAARTRVSFYGSTRTYHGVFEAHGWTDIGPRLHEMSLKGMWGEMPKAVPDDVLEQFVIMGTHDQIVGRIRERFGGICTRIGFSIPTNTPEEEEVATTLIKELKAV